MIRELVITFVVARVLFTWFWLALALYAGTP